MVQIYKFTKYFLFCYLFNLGISNAADSFQEKFLEAAKKGDFEEVKALKALGAQLSYANEKGRTALHEAARGGHENIVRYLVEEGANIRAEDKDLHTACYYAINNDSVTILKFLYDNGASLEEKDNYTGATLLDRAACKGSLGTIEFLLSKKY